MNKKQQKIYKWLSKNPGYIKKGKIAGHILYSTMIEDTSQKNYDAALKQARRDFPNHYNGNKSFPIKEEPKIVINKNPIIFAKKVSINHFKLNPNNVLIIGDTHEPFCKDGYLEHCLAVQKEYNCGTVVHIGDLVDNHAVSYHEHDPDGKSPGEEYKLALERCQKWYQAFPNVKICIGNHDKLPFRKAFTAGLPANWLKSYQEMFNSPKGWDWDFIHKINGVIYQHGTGMSGEMASVNAARENRQSTVIGHLHTVSNIRFLASQKDLIFGMSVGCGIDHAKYAFAYGKEAPRKPVLSCGVVIDGKLPINIPMNLNK